MYRYLLAGTALAALATPLAAQTTVDNTRTQTVRTSQLDGGAGDDVKVTTNGSIELTSGSGIIVDSDHDATNEGEIDISNSDGSSGIETTGDRQSDITNSGDITIDETYTPTDVDNDNDPDGPFAVGTDRAGIRVRGNLTGNIVNSGDIFVEGNDSWGIAVAGTLDGKFVHDGETGVLVTPGDVQGFADALAPYCTDAQLRARHGAAGLERSQPYTWEAINASMVDTYLRLANAREKQDGPQADASA